MQYIEVISKTNYGKVGIAHSIFQNGDTILSFEGNVFKIHSLAYLDDRTIKKTITIPSFDLKQYEGYKLDGYTCFEALEYICKLNGVTMNTGRLKTSLILAVVLFITHFITIVVGVVIGLKLNNDLVKESMGQFVGTDILDYIFE